MTTRQQAKVLDNRLFEAQNEDDVTISIVDDIQEFRTAYLISKGFEYVGKSEEGFHNPIFTKGVHHVFLGHVNTFALSTSRHKALSYWFEGVELFITIINHISK